jgi:hypothetical protein
VSKPKSRFKLIVSREERVAATPETQAKLKPCQIRRLVECGFLNASHQQAAYDILKAFRTLATAGYRSMDLTSLHIRGNGEWSHQTELLMTNLQDWWRDMHGAGLDPGFVYDLVLDGADVPLGSRSFLKRSLDLYVKLKGFRLEKVEAVV